MIDDCVRPIGSQVTHASTLPGIERRTKMLGADLWGPLPMID